MPKVHSRYFGEIEYLAAEPFFFPEGLPGFPSETRFIPIEAPDQLPLVYLQSLRSPDLCFIALPARSIVPEYRLSPGADLSSIDLDADSLAGTETLILALICFDQDGGASANLRAPIVINVKTRRGVQAVQVDDRYPMRFTLEPQPEVSTC